MKKIKKLPLICFFALLAIVLILGFVFGGHSIKASADDYYDEYALYSFYFEDYDVTYDVKSNCEINVTEKLTITFTGRDSTGFLKDIPVNDGELVKNIKVKELVGNTETSVYYKVLNEDIGEINKFITVDIGDTSYKRNETHTYLITYKYCLTKIDYKNELYFNAIGAGRASWCDIKNATATLILPQGYVDGKYFLGTVLSSNGNDCTAQTENGKTVIRLESLALAGNEGLTFKLNFENGALSTYFDFTPYVFVIIAAIIFVALLAVKFIFFNKAHLTPVVNFETPKKMDPLLMGKLIDTKINSEDITSMIFYFADKGYLKINLENQDNPVLIRIVQKLPEDATDYERLMFNNLFLSGEIVRVSQLQYRFYKTVERVTSIVNSKVKKLHTSASIGVAIIFAVLAGLLLGIAPFITGLATISLKYWIFLPFISIAPILLIFGLSETLRWYELKYNRSKKAVYGLAIAAVCALFVVVYMFLLVPNGVIGWLPNMLLSVLCCLIATCSASVISRSNEYVEQLNEIVGFKNFILLAEKDRLEAMLEDDPQFYYHILPYAQVLGVSDKWEEKFKEITVEPPQWATGSFMGTVFRFHVFNTLLNRSMMNMSRNMIARPSSSGSSGFGGRGGGGHVGGGHGGGGFRGR